MSNEASYLYEPVRVEEFPQELPGFEIPLFKKPKNNTNKTESASRVKKETTSIFKQRAQNIFDDKKQDSSDTNSGTKSNQFYY